jgi:DNA polymerase III alpha subunit
MRLDKFRLPVYSSSDILELLYQGRVDILSNLVVDEDEDIQLYNLHSDSPLRLYQELDMDLKEFDRSFQQEWLMPEEYKKMDIESFLVDSCPEENYQRLIEELQEYRQRDMLNLLRWLKYFVDTCRKNNVVWGVGRGSSVASYVLYLIGVHKIDSIKYNLDWREFLR